MNSLLTKTSTIAMTLAMSVAVPIQAFAQDESETRNAKKLDEIIVTARARDESIQDVPLAISAFDAQEIARRGIQELEDVARFTAGFAFEDFDGGNANPVIRGQTTLRASGREQTVATFLDGVYMPRSWLVDLGVSNLERVEIVKGPQSARYGRNAFAGAINFISKKAEDNSAEGTVTYGSDERFDYGLAASFDIFDDILAVRGSVDHSEFDGSWKNNHPNTNADVEGGTRGNVGGYDNDSYSVNVVFNPTSSLSVDASYYGFEISEEARASNFLNTSATALPVGSLAATPQGNCGALQARSPLAGAQILAADPNADPTSVFSLFCGEYPPPSDAVTMDPRGFGRQANADIFRVSLEYDISESLSASYLYGNVVGKTRTAISAESDTVNCGTILGPDINSPFFPTPLCNFQGSPRGDVSYDQHDFRLTFNDDGPIFAVVGGFLLDGTDTAQAVSINETPLSTTPLGNGFSFRNEQSITEVAAIFGEFEYDFGKTRIGVEARYTNEKITGIDLRGRRADVSDTFKFFTPKVTVEHDYNEDHLLYATVGRGAKAGGFNTNAISDDLVQFQPETNWTYEVGSKSYLMGGRATLNTAVFLTDWSDMQVTIADPLGVANTATLTANQGNATVYGVEIEGALQATENLSFDAAFSYSKGTFNDGTIDLGIAGGNFNAFFPNPCDGIVCELNGDIGGNELPRAPNTQLSLGGQWDGQLNSDWEYYIRGDGAYQSSFFADTINAGVVRDRTVFNASAGISHDNIELSLWARNLGDNKYVSNSFQIIQSGSTNILGSNFGERRTVGATLKVKYN